MPEPIENPTEHLLGMELAGGWLVVEKIKYGVDHSGGNFSVCYKVRRDGQMAFLKAVDMSRAMKSEDPMKSLQILTTAYEYEKELLEACDGRKMDRVVKILGSGTVTPLEHNPKELFVPYLIFELAETTIREHVLQIAAILDNACLMRSLHHVAVGISQLHAAGIVHQDLKGSNVLLFHLNGSSKVSDLGSAEVNTKRSVKYHFIVAGDPDYAPPEQIVGHKDDDWDVRRKATDLYHLGSLITFYYTQITMTAFYQSQLPVEFKHGAWNGQYAEVLPIMKLAFQEILETIEGQLQDTFSDIDIARTISKLVKYLCDPDPAKRGHPDDLPIEKYSMTRFIAIFDNLANKFESKLL
jgi:serine/threonine protein kinase